ncbi:hypothetical protein [Dyadobacter sp. OTU695]|uniref:hypothetical protein n=1 Tax=Dyadobacter sp. OTU695 TaxID=3043860 RepID=UPI00406BE786
MEQLRILSDKWVEAYSSKHPHTSMKGLTPNQKCRLVGDGAVETENHNSLAKSKTVTI